MKRTNTTSLIFVLIMLASWQCWPNKVFAQKPADRDSLLEVFKTTTEDTTRINALLDLGYTYLRTNPDSAQFYAQKALVLAEQTNHLSGTAKALKDLGLIEWARSNYQGALEKLTSALTLFESLGYEAEMAKCLNNIGYMYYEIGQYPKAIENHKAYLRIMRRMDDQRGEAGALHNIGMVHQAKGNYQEAMDFYLQSVSVKKALGDSARLSNSLEALGDIYFELRNYDTALKHYQRAFKIREKDGNKLGMVVSLYNIGRVYKEQGEYYKGLGIFQQGKRMAEELDNNVLIAYHLEGIGSVYKKMESFDQSLTAYKASLKLRNKSGDQKGRSILLSELADLYIQLEAWKEAMEMAREAYEIATTLRAKEEIKDAAFNLAKIYSHQGQFQESYYYLDQVNELKDSLFNAEKNREMALLTAQHEIKAAKIEREKELKERKVRTQRQYIGGLTLGMLLIILLAVALWFANQQRKSANKQLTGKNQELSDKKKNLEKLNRELKMANQKLELAGQKLQQFAFAASHDLKESIRSVTSFGQLMERQLKSYEKTNPNWLTYLGYISSSGKRMEKTLVDLVDYLNLGAKSDDFVEVDLNVVLKKVVTALDTEIEHSGALLEVSYMPTVFAHPHLIEQLFLNLIDNAIKFRRKNVGLKIEVGFQHNPKQELVFFVRDNGIGMESRYFDYIFEPFKRLHNRNRSGSGLGLSIAQNIVKLYDGQMTVESIVGEGSIFMFTLPQATMDTIIQEPITPGLQEIS